MPVPFLVRVRIKGTDRWVGKKNPSYAFMEASDPTPRVHERLFQPSNYAHWWVNEPQATVFTTLATLRATVTMGRVDNNLLPDLELIHADGSIQPLDELCPPKAKKRR